VNRYIAVSKDIADYLIKAIGVRECHVSLIPNGVDTDQFAPASETPAAVKDCPFIPGQHWMIGTVGRLQTVKNQPMLARAFVRLLQTHAEAASRVRLVIIGEGPLRVEIEEILAQAGFARYAWIPGARDDVADILKILDCFILPSRAEGTSCTLQEAMACGLPIVATAVGGTPDLVEDGTTGILVAPDDDFALADAIWRYYSSPEIVRSHGNAARNKALREFGVDRLVAGYDRLFSGEAPSG